VGASSFLIGAHGADLVGEVTGSCCEASGVIKTKITQMLDKMIEVSHNLASVLTTGQQMLFKN
jgi:hypothetical protein